jgi:hypothetical protein
MNIEGAADSYGDSWKGEETFGRLAFTIRASVGVAEQVTHPQVRSMAMQQVLVWWLQSFACDGVQEAVQVK